VFWGGGPPPSKAEKGEGFLGFRTGGGEPVPLNQVTGVVMQRQPVLSSQIRDGLSNVYFAGEKWLPPEDYDSGKNYGDDQSSWNGDDLDMVRSTASPPKYDGAAADIVRGPFGSAHGDGLNMVRCDASVQFVAYQIDGDVFRSLGNRRDGQASAAR
jgi:hypothetical protein